jgi:hypothetical protein
MAGFLAAHGYDPGPSQRPLSAGAISGVLATLPAIPVLVACGSLRVESEILGMSALATLGVGWLIMAIAGALYARLFGRAANAVRSGWLFGMSFGFGVWAAGAVLLLPLLSGGRTPAGLAATGLAMSLLVWGAAVGLLVPFVHRPLHESLERASKRREVGPDAAVGKDRTIREQRQERRQ